MQPITIKLEDPNAASTPQVRHGQRNNAPMPWKLFWTMFGASLSIAGAVIPTMLDVVWWKSAGVVAIVSIILLCITGFVVRTADMFSLLRSKQQDRITHFCMLAISAYTVWTQVYLMRSEWWPWMLTVLVVLGIGIYWGCKGVEYWISHSKPIETEVKAAVDPIENSAMVGKFRPVLNKAGFSQVRIIGHETVRDDRSQTAANQFLVQVPASGR